MQKRQHSREFKLDVVRRVNMGELRPAQACREREKQVQQNPSVLLNLNGFVGNWRWKIKC